MPVTLKSDRRGLTLLKIDCEGCEFVGLLPFLRHTPTQQVVVEVRGCLVTKSISARQAAGLPARPKNAILIID